MVGTLDVDFTQLGIIGFPRYVCLSLVGKRCEPIGECCWCVVCLIFLVSGFVWDLEKT